jgi:hypothetical protein
MKKATNIISWIGLLPLWGHVAILFYYVKARLYLGHFPVPSVPDPKDLPFHTTYHIVEMALGTAFILELFILACMAILLVRSIFASPMDGRAFFLLLLGRVLFWSFGFTKIFEWFLD